MARTDHLSGNEAELTCTTVAESEPEIVDREPDGIADAVDNCPDDYNPDQADMGVQERIVSVSSVDSRPRRSSALIAPGAAVRHQAPCLEPPTFAS